MEDNHNTSRTITANTGSTSKMTHSGNNTCMSSNCCFFSSNSNTNTEANTNHEKTNNTLYMYIYIYINIYFNNSSPQPQLACPPPSILVLGASLLDTKSTPNFEAAAALSRFRCASHSPSTRQARQRCLNPGISSFRRSGSHGTAKGNRKEKSRDTKVDLEKNQGSLFETAL